MNDLLKVVWDALHTYREDCIPEGDLMYDEQWNEVCNAMFHIQEVLGIEHKDID
tara:strand:- start:28 stop:189 length:162 start_codon:yes stop_codon:yes gene_type:complete